jgi:hypothetical protein
VGVSTVGSLFEKRYMADAMRSERAASHVFQDGCTAFFAEILKEMHSVGPDQAAEKSPWRAILTRCADLQSQLAFSPADAKDMPGSLDF